MVLIKKLLCQDPLSYRLSHHKLRPVLSLQQFLCQDLPSYRLHHQKFRPVLNLQQLKLKIGRKKLIRSSRRCSISLIPLSPNRLLSVLFLLSEHDALNLGPVFPAR
jgi:hypothetical protein